MEPFNCDFETRVGPSSAAQIVPFLLTIVLFGTESRTTHAGEFVLRSPNERVVLKVENDAKSGTVRYSVERDGRKVIEPSLVDVRLRNVGSIVAGSAIPKAEPWTVDEMIELPWGKTSRIRNHHRGTVLRIVGESGVKWILEVCVFDDGIAFCYGIPRQNGVKEIEIEEENIEFRLADNPTVLFTTCKNFTTSHEELYDRKALTDVPAATLLDKPLTAVWPNGVAASITEAGLSRYAGMYLERPEADSTVLRTRLSPLPDGSGVLVRRGTLVWSPWRVVLLADKAGELIENNVLLCLNDPPNGDFSWVEPGKTTFHWWNGAVEHGKESTPEINFAIHKEYIDFCAKYGIEYHSVISVAGSRPWHVQRDPGFAEPHADTDVRAARADIDLPRILQYAKEKGVGIRLWVNWKPLSEHPEEAFAQYEKWGIRGLMVDFMDRDDQEMVEWQEKCLEAAARHKLHIQFHGSYKPTGEQRTYPNLFNREGVLNLEYSKWSDLVTPAHSVNVAYTRLLAGPVDYHLGGFRAVPRSEFKPVDLMPLVMGTRCNQLALYIVYENPMPMLADAPSAYENQAGFDFLVNLPTTWDETKFVAGEMGDYIVVARRKGKDWYLGGITNWDGRALSLPLNFLGDGTYTATLLTDRDAAKPNELVETTRHFTPKDSLDVTLVSGGGLCAVFKPRQ
jgi:alpha-glucosidase